MRLLFLSRRFPPFRLGYVTEVIDREGLEKRHTETRQGKHHALPRISTHVLPRES